MMNEIPYALYVMNDVSHNDTSQNELSELPISVEIVPYKAISINDIQIILNQRENVRRIRRSRDEYMSSRFKYLFFLVVSIPIILVMTRQFEPN
jgi:hypothetical protein